jgi:hypothetical protein
MLALLADLFAQVVVHPVEGAVAGPSLEVVVDQFRVREIGGQRVPLTAGPVEVADRVHDVAAWVDDRGGPGRCRRVLRHVRGRSTRSPMRNAAENPAKMTAVNCQLWRSSAR